MVLATPAIASAAPVLPNAQVAQQAVQQALQEPQPASRPVAAAPAAVAVAAPKPAVAPKAAVVAPTPKVASAPAKPAAPAAQNTAAKARQQGVQLAAKTAAAKTATRPARTAVVRATAYNSLPNQTDSTPFITATGTRTRFGVIALSRDLLRRFPYGTRVRIEDLSGKYTALLSGTVFVVEDTMHPRKTNQIDIWMGSRSQALQWGARNVRITALN